MTEDNTTFRSILDGMSEKEQGVFLDEIVRIKEQEHADYMGTLEDDDPLKAYAAYYLRTEKEIEDDEEEAPLLFATVPMDATVPKIKNPDELIPVLTPVQITGITGFGEVMINTNLESTKNHNARVNYATLTNYRSEAVYVQFNP